jgi:2-dehydro-3-deoxy-D-arabinonate dehydratase
MKIYRTPTGVNVHSDRRWHSVRDFSFDRLFREREPLRWLRDRLMDGGREPRPGELPPPLESQEVWAAGVTYLRSREARMEESEREADVYDRVYDADRPELFFKATASRVVGQGGEVRIRADSSWNVPEAELAVAVNSYGEIIGYSIGNDMSSRSIEGENPLYLPQAKIYDGSCALGPCLFLAEEPLPATTRIYIRITRGESEVFSGSARLAQMKRTLQELVEHLYRECSFPNGCYLLTGTGIVPERGFTLAAEDQIEIAIEPIGTLANRVA